MPEVKFQLKGVFEFDWDEGNQDKNRQKHDVSQKECEEVFNNRPLKIFPDRKHSRVEVSFLVLGTTHKGRQLSIFFTFRDSKVRVISASQQSRKERGYYEKYKTNSAI